MPKFLSDDPFASASADGRQSRKPSLALLIFLIPIFCFTGLLYGTQAKFSRSGCHSYLSDPDTERANRAEHRAAQIREIESARLNVLYWTHRCRQNGPQRAMAEAKLVAWQHGYRQRQRLFARMYLHGKCDHFP